MLGFHRVTWCLVWVILWLGKCEGWLRNSQTKGFVRKWLLHVSENECVKSSKIIIDVDENHKQYVKSLLGEEKLVSVVNDRSNKCSSSDIKVMFPTTSFHSSETSTSQFSLMLLGEDSEIDKERLQQIISIRKGENTNRLPMELEVGKWSHFLSLTIPDLSTHRQLLSALRQGIDAWELRIDLLADQSLHSVHRHIAYLRSFNPHIPIIYTVRTISQLGKYPDDKYDQIEALLLEGIRAGVEWLDLEASLPEKLQQKIISFLHNNPLYKQQTRLIGSYHTTEPLNAMSNTKVFQLLEKCLLPSQQADIIKLVTNATDTSDNYRIHSLCQQFLQNRSIQPHSKSPSYIAVCLGRTGELSRVLNQHFTPVTHPSLTTSAAPGQLSVTELQSRRQHLSLLNKKHFYLFGSNVSYSLSPAMHNEAFRVLQLPHQYQIMDAPSIEVYSSFLDKQRSLGKNSTFGGASVTIPYKESIIPCLDALSPAAVAIGAVNTIVVSDLDATRVQYVGHNTDWLGMFRPLSDLLSRSKSTSMQETTRIGIVVGAGGTARAACYAMTQLGLKVYVVNRNISKAEEIAHRFNGSAISFEDFSSLEPSIVASVRVVISTLPAAANFTLPATFVKRVDHHVVTPIVLDVVYTPALTPLLKQAKELGWDTVQGATMLWRQGMEQFQMWHERQAPVVEMRSAIFKTQEEEVADANSAIDRRVLKVDSV